MQATRLIVETDEQGRIMNLPRLSPRTRMEVIFLDLDEPVAGVRREPPSAITGQGVRPGEVIAPPAEWVPPRPRQLGDFQAPVEDWRILANESDAVR